MRKILIMIATILFIPTMVWAWAIHCENGSCEAKSGRLAVYWQAEDMNTRMYFGMLTGVEGLPISIEDFESAEKRLNQSFDKSISYKKSQDANVKGNIPGVEGVSGGAGTSDSGEMGFTKKKSMDIGKSKGQRVSINYVLDFVKWVGDTRMSNSYFTKLGDIGRYTTAAEAIMDWYYNNTLQIPLAEYIFTKGDPEKLGEIAIDTPIDEDTKELVLAKYIAFVDFPNIKNPKERYIKAYREATFFLYSSKEEDTKFLATLNADYKKHVANLKYLLEPGETSLSLYEQGKKSLAMAKWIGDNKLKATYLTDLKEKYLSGLIEYEKLSNPEIYSQEDKKGAENDFENTIKTKSPEVVKVAIPKPPLATQVRNIITKHTLLVLSSIFPVMAGIGYIIYRKRAKKTITATILLLTLLIPNVAFASESENGGIVSKEVIESLKKDIEKAKQLEHNIRPHEEIVDEIITSNLMLSFIEIATNNLKDHVEGKIDFEVIINDQINNTNTKIPIAEKTLGYLVLKDLKLLQGDKVKAEDFFNLYGLNSSKLAS